MILENIANNNADYGIWIESLFCDDCKIIGNILNKNQYGLYFFGATSHNNIITGNTMNRNNRGIYIGCTGNNSLISNNILYNNRDRAISLGVGYILTGNLMKGSGLALGHASVEALSLLNIDTSNLVNNKYVYYYINKSYLKQEDFNYAGQIFLINCINSVISNRNVSNSTQGISLFHSNNITVVNVNSSYNLDGIYVYNTNNSIFTRNTLNEGAYGIELRGKNNTISENDITNNGYGIDFGFNSDYNTISENNINENFFGIWIMGCRFNTIKGNIIKDNYVWGLHLIGGVFACRNNTFFLNFFIRNGIHVEGSAINLNDNAWNNTDVGNYWDNYTGFDNNGNGIGDTPHIISLSPLIIDYLPIVDNDPPIITIIKPINSSKFGSLAPSFNIRVEEKYLDVMWYTLDGGLINFTITENNTINQNAWSSIPEGSVKLQFYAMDKTGKIGSVEVTIIKESQKTEEIPGFNLIILISIISMISVIMVKVREKKIII
jgi:parallel beta-helix repeat protein